MGQGIQQTPVAQSGGNAFLDVFKVLYEPGAVFERVRARPSFLAPFLTIIAVQCVLFVINLPFLKAAVAAQMATAAAGRPAPSAGMLAVFGLVGLVIVMGLILTVTGAILWVLTSLLGGGEAKFSTLLSVAVYSAVPATILLGIIGTIVLQMKGTAAMTSPADMQPALGLDLLAPGTKGFLGAVLKSINPFSIWGLVLTAIGVSTTQRTSQSSGYVIASISFAIGLLIAGVFGTFNR